MNRIDKIIKKLNELALLEGLEDEMDSITEDLEYAIAYALFDIEKFRFELERQGLLTKELDEFIENYMRFDNN